MPQLVQDQLQVVGPQGVNEPLVSRESFFRAECQRFSPEVDGHRPLQFQQYRFERQIELTVARQGDHGGMEGPVRIVLAELVEVPLSLAHAVEPIVKLSELVVLRLSQRKDGPDGMLFEDQPNPEQLFDIGVAELGDPNTTTRQMLYETLLGEESQGLSQRRSADREPQPDLVLDEPLPGREGAGQDLVP